MVAAPLLPLLTHRLGLAPPAHSRLVSLHLAVTVVTAHVVPVTAVVVVAAAPDCDSFVGTPAATANKIQLNPVAFFRLDYSALYLAIDLVIKEHSLVAICCLAYVPFNTAHLRYHTHCHTMHSLFFFTAAANFIWLTHYKWLVC